MLKRIESNYNKIEEIGLVIGLAVMVVVIFLQVIMRYAFSNSLSWSEELARYLFVWISWLGISLAQRKGEHIRITILMNALRGKRRMATVVIADLCTLAILLVLVVKGFDATAKIMELSSKSPALGIPTWAMYVPIPLSCALMSLRIIKHIVFTIQGRELEAIETEAIG